MSLKLIHKCSEKLTNYSAIGFDMDHTFIRYKLKNFIDLVYTSHVKFLIEHKDYPKELIPKNNLEKEYLYSMFFRAVFDYKTGYLLKIGWDNLILRGYLGYKRLTQEEIENQYGNPPKIPNYYLMVKVEKHFSNLHEYYGTALMPIIANITDLKESKKYPVLNNKTYYDIIADIYKGSEYNYRPDLKGIAKGDINGHFFPKLLRETEQLIYKVRNELLEKVKSLREQGVMVFISSNSVYEIADILMLDAVGENWHDHFDLLMYGNKKPKFFTGELDERPFTNLKGEEFTDITEFMERKKQGDENVLIGGNGKIFNSYLEKKYGADYKVLYFGDTIVADCIYSLDDHYKPNWHSVLILEELQELCNFDHSWFYDYRDLWGSALKEKNPYTNEDCTIIYHFARHVAHRYFDRMDSIYCLDYLTI